MFITWGPIPIETRISRYKPSSIYTYTDRYIYIGMYIDIYIYIFIFTYIYIHIYIYTYIHIYIYIHIHICMIIPISRYPMSIPSFPHFPYGHGRVRRWSSSLSVGSRRPRRFIGSWPRRPRPQRVHAELSHSKVGPSNDYISIMYGL